MDATYRRALEWGCVSRLEPTVAPWGERFAGFADPWDNRWSVGSPAFGDVKPAGWVERNRDQR